MGNAWWSVIPPAAGVFTPESMERGWSANEARSPMMFLPPRVADYYRKMLVRMRWKEMYREWRMFRTACEKGWLG